MGPRGSTESFHSCLSMCHGWGPQQELKTQAGSNQREIHYHKSKHKERFKSGKLYDDSIIYIWTIYDEKRKEKNYKKKYEWVARN